MTTLGGLVINHKLPALQCSKILMCDGTEGDAAVMMIKLRTVTSGRFCRSLLEVPRTELSYTGFWVSCEYVRIDYLHSRLSGHAGTGFNIQVPCLTVALSYS